MANLILIGPPCIGKSTVAAWVNHLANLPNVSLDDRKHRFHSSNLPGFAESEITVGPWMKRYRSWKPFELESAEKHISNVDKYVIDFGAGHSVYEENDQFERIARAVKEHYVVLLMPSEDLEKSRKILLETHPAFDSEFINLIIDNPSNRKLANLVVYRDCKTAKEVALEVLKNFRDWASPKP